MDMASTPPLRMSGSLPTLGIEVRGLKFSYHGSNRDFRLVVPSLTLRSGELISLYGPNGSGKTTLLRLLVGALRPGAGTISWSCDGRSLLPRIGQHVVLTNGATPFPHFTVEENIRHVANGAQGRRIVDMRNLLEEWGLLELRSRFPHQLSVGQAQRVVLARALSVDASAYLLDEIESAQSESWARRVGEALRGLAARGRMVVVISHDPTWIVSHCDRVLELSGNGANAGKADSVDGSGVHVAFGVGYSGPVSTWPRLAVLAGRWSGERPQE